MNIFFRTQTASITPCQRLASPSLPTHRPLEEIGERGLSVPLVLCSGGGDGAARGVLCTRARVGTSALVSVGGGGEETMGEEAFKRERKYERDTRGGKKMGIKRNIPVLSYSLPLPLASPLIPPLAFPPTEAHTPMRHLSNVLPLSQCTCAVNVQGCDQRGNENLA